MGIFRKSIQSLLVVAGPHLLRLMLFSLALMLKTRSLVDPVFRKRLKEKNLTARIRIKDKSIGRTFYLKKGSISSTSDMAKDVDVTMTFLDAATAVYLMLRRSNLHVQIHALKNFHIEVEGPDDLTIWFMQTLVMVEKFDSPRDFGTPLKNGVMRYTSNTNGGPVFVHVKDDKIIRIIPIEFDEEDFHERSGWV